MEEQVIFQNELGTITDRRVVFDGESGRVDLPIQHLVAVEEERRLGIGQIAMGLQTPLGAGARGRRRGASKITIKTMGGQSYRVAPRRWKAQVAKDFIEALRAQIFSGK